MPPANDAFTSPTVITGGAGSEVFSNVGATSDFGTRADGHTVWFAWTPTVSQGVEFSTRNTPAPLWDSTLAVYLNQSPRTGAALGYVYRIAFDDDGDPQPGETFGTSKVRFYADAGVTYYICVDAYDDPSPGERTDLVLSWATAPLRATAWITPPAQTVPHIPDEVQFDAPAASHSVEPTGVDVTDWTALSEAAPPGTSGTGTPNLRVQHGASDSSKRMSHLNMYFAWALRDVEVPFNGLMQAVVDFGLAPSGPTILSLSNQIDGWTQWNRPTSVSPVDTHVPYTWLESVILHFKLQDTTDSGGSTGTDTGRAVAYLAAAPPTGTERATFWLTGADVDALTTRGTGTFGTGLNDWTVTLPASDVQIGDDEFAQPTIWSYVILAPDRQVSHVAPAAGAFIVGELYGSLDDFTAEVVYQPPDYRFIYEVAVGKPLRQHPRDDALGGTPRQGHQSRSVQASARQGWIGTYR